MANKKTKKTKPAAAKKGTSKYDTPVKKSKKSSKKSKGY